jgi:hypothetical protein
VQIIMFLITGSAVLCASLTILLAIVRLVDDQHRIRPDHLVKGDPWTVQLLRMIRSGFVQLWVGLRSCTRREAGVSL